MRKVINSISGSTLTFIAILWIGVMYAQFSIDPARSIDTESYVTNPVQLDVYFSLSGYAVRSWPSVLLFWLVDNDFKRTVLHSLLYAAGFTFVLFSWSINKTKKVSLITGLLILVLALSPLALQWNHFILAESLTISLLLFGFGFSGMALSAPSELNFVSNKFSSIWVIFSILFFSLAAVNRASLIPILFVPIFFLAFMWRRKIIGNLVSIAVLLLIIASFIYPIFYHGNSSRYVGDKIFPLNRTAYNFMLNSAADGPEPHWANLLWESVTKSGPECLKNNRGIWNSKETPEKGPLGQTFAFPQTCPEAIPYLNENSNKEYAKFIISNPKENIKFLASTITGTADAFGMPMVTIMPITLTSIFESTSDGIQKYRPIVVWIIFGISMSIYFLLNYKKVLISTLASITLFIFSLASIMLTELMIVVETVRTASPAVVATFLSCILLLGELVQLKDKTNK